MDNKDQSISLIYYTAWKCVLYSVNYGISDIAHLITLIKEKLFHDEKKKNVIN